MMMLGIEGTVSTPTGVPPQRMKKGEVSTKRTASYGGPRSYATAFRRIRVALNMTQDETARRVGKSSAAYRNYERAVFTPPDDVIEKMGAMARVGGLTELADALEGAKPVDRAYLDETSLGETEIAAFARFVEVVPADVSAAMLESVRALTERYAPGDEDEDGDDDGATP